MKNRLLISAAILFPTLSLMGQNAGFSLKQCISYALESSTEMKNAQLERLQADNKTKQIQGRALPHVEASVDLVHNVNIQKIILENGAIPAFTNPAIPYGEVIAFQLQLKNALVANLNASQVLFDKSLLTGLKSQHLYKELAGQKLEQSRTEVIEWVSKSYYGVLISDQQLAYLNSNVQRLDSVYRESKAKLAGGLVRPIDVFRVEVALNNAREDQKNAERNLALSKSLLAYYMNYDQPASLVLTDKLDENALEQSVLNNSKFMPSDRIEYKILQTQKRLGEMNTKLAKDAYYPRLTAFATSGYNPAATHLSDITQSSRYYNYTYLGARLQIPVFGAFDKHLKLKDELLEEEKMKNTLDKTGKRLQLSSEQASINFEKAMESLRIQKRNVELATQNLQLIETEMRTGVVNNLELIQAEGDLRAARQNYYQSLYMVFLHKVDLEKAMGKLAQ